MSLARVRKECAGCGKAIYARHELCGPCRGYGRKRHPTPDGYIRAYRPGHPMANRDGHALEHRLVVFEAGIDVPRGHHVHHRNGAKTDNRIENLEVVDAVTHARRHARENGLIVNQFGVHPLRGERACERCGQSFTPLTNRGRFCSRSCANRRSVSLR